MNNPYVGKDLFFHFPYTIACAERYLWPELHRLITKLAPALSPPTDRILFFLVVVNTKMPKNGKDFRPPEGLFSTRGAVHSFPEPWGKG